MRLLPAVLLALVSAASEAAEPPLDQRLRDGGFVLYLPHTSAERPHPAAFRDPPDCAPGTRLTDSGWQMAKAVGIGLRKRGILIETAYASPVCAARHTAYLVFGADRVHLDAGLALDCAGAGTAAWHAAPHLRALAGAPPPYPGVNIAVVAHACNLAPLAIDWPECAKAPPAGSVVVLRAEGGELRWIGCLAAQTVREWSREAGF